MKILSKICPKCGTEHDLYIECPECKRRMIGKGISAMICKESKKLEVS